MLQKAREVIAQHNRTVLERRDWERFLDILDSEDEPTHALMKAAERHMKCGE